MTWLETLPERIRPLDETAMDAARRRLDQLTKPRGSLGRLEALAVQLAGITGKVLPDVERSTVLVFAGDHGVARRGVSAYPSEVTAQMVSTFLRGGAAINVLAGLAGASVVVVDVGVAGEIPVGAGAAPPAGSAGPAARLVRCRIGEGTRDLAAEPAMTPAETLAAIDAGRSAAEDAIAGGSRLLAVGEMGICNTTAASAIAAALTGAPAGSVTGRGTGVDDAGLERKVATVEAALDRHGPIRDDPLEVLASLGGFEIAALVGAILAAADAGVPVVLDGFITGAAALVAASIAPAVGPRLIASHRSPEPGHAVVLDRLGLAPLLDLGLRLGEGSGAALALPLVAAAAAIPCEMATFSDAGVSGAG